MKRMVLTFAVIAFTASLAAQRLSADEFFNKYSDRDGYTTVVINGSLLVSLVTAKAMIRKTRFVKSPPYGWLSGRRMVSLQMPDFLSEIRNIIRRGSYEELMSVRDVDTDLRFMVRSDREMVKEMLLVIDGDDAAVIQIKGNLTRDEASRLFESDGEGLAILEGLEISGD
jgi:hypothetical protein